MKTNFYCFSKNGKYYAIDTIRIIPVKLKYKTYSCLMDIKKRGNSVKNEDLSEWKNDDLNFFACNDILMHSKDYYVKNTFKELNISLIPVQKCNLNCRYCYSHSKKGNNFLSTDRVSDVVSFFCKNFEFSCCRIDFVSGGEPLYNPDLLKKIVNIIDTKLTENNKYGLYWLCTNGLLINNDILSFLDDKHFNMGISLDGPQEINDYNRVDHHGNGTYCRVLEGISCIQKNKTLSRNIKNLWNCAVITSHTRSLVEVMRNSYELGFKNLQMKLVWSKDDAIRLSTEKTIELYEELTQYLYDLIRQKRFEEFLCICNENDTYGKILLRIILQSGVTRRCNAGINKFSISAEGKLYPCDSFLGIEEFCIGDVYEGINEKYDTFGKMMNNDIIRCKECWAKYICGGECFYHAYLNSGSPWIPDDRNCKIKKKIIEMCIVLVVELYSSYPQEMQKVYAILSKRTIRMEPK